MEAENLKLQSLMANHFWFLQQTETYCIKSPLQALAILSNSTHTYIVSRVLSSYQDSEQHQSMMSFHHLKLECSASIDHAYSRAYDRCHL
jgi:hypothetical protein